MTAAGAGGVEPDGRGGPHVFVDDLGAPALSADDRHHLSRVLRIRTGDPLTVGDGRGRWAAARFGAELTLTGPVHEVAPPALPLTVGFALVKAAKPELVVQKLTEIGVDRIVPFRAERSVVRWDEAKASDRLRRLVTVAREAAMQSRRVWLPEVAPLADLAVLRTGVGVVLADRGGRPVTANDRVVLVGPEGGWTPDELAGADTVALGAHVLRAETAAIAAGVLMTALRVRS